MRADAAIGQRERPHPASPAAAVAVTGLAPFSTRLPLELIERLRIASPQLGLRQGEIAATAIDAFLRERGF